MKHGIHPTYEETQVTCACGNSWLTRSTRKVIRTDLCSKCHPYFTGEHRIVDTAGQVDRFLRRFQLASTDPRRNKRAERALARRARVTTTAEEEVELEAGPDDIDRQVVE